MRYTALVILLLLPLWGSVWSDGLPFGTVPSRLTGIDVSHHQQRINWDTVASRRAVDFAFVKATEGRDFTDSLFCHNWEDLRRLGIRRGAYHFFRPQGCGDEQARHFLATIDMYPGDMAPVLDVETTDGMPSEIMITEMRVWLQMVEERLRVRPIIYTNQFFYEKYLAGIFDRYPLWVAKYSSEIPLLTNNKAWDLWQYDNQGCIDGISRRVDLNIFEGTSDMFERLCLQPEPAENASPIFNMGKVAP
jgi:lysozyme